MENNRSDTIALIVTVDVEEADPNLWKRDFKTTYSGEALGHLRHIDAIQNIYDKYSITPIYFIDYSISSDKDAASLIKDIYKNKRCHIGAHMHPWCTPPFDEERSNRNSFFNNLSPDLQRKKIRHLTESIKAIFSMQPTCFRSGRFGFSAEVAHALREFGYLVDSSITPFYNWQYIEGPDFSNAPYRPYWMSMQDIFREDKKSDLLEVPLSHGFNKLNFALCRYIFNKCGLGILSNRLHISRLLAAPEQESLNNLKKLASNYQYRRLPVWNIYFHSSSLVIGGNIYIKAEAERRSFLNKLDLLFSWCLNEAGFRTSTLQDTREELLRQKQR